MGAEHVRKERVRICIKKIYSILQGCSSLEEALSGGAQTNSLKMKLRHFHNELELHVHRHSAGAVYRSEGIVGLAANGALESTLIRCEHTIPAHVVAGMIYNHLRSASIEQLADFLLTQTIVTAIKRDEDKHLLSKVREFDGRSSKWRDTHPDFDHSSAPLHPNEAGDRTGGRPFRRYDGTGIKIFCWLGSEPCEINLSEYTLRDHRNLMRQYALFQWETYFDKFKEAA